MPDSPVIRPYDDRARTNGADADPVLAELPERFRFHPSAAPRRHLTRIAGLVGLAAIITGMVLISTDTLAVVSGAAVVVLGFALVVPMMLRLRSHGESEWTELARNGSDADTTTATRRDAVLQSNQFWLAGDADRAGELHEQFTTEVDARRWPTLRRTGRADGIQVGLHRRRSGCELILTIWIRGEESNLCWPAVRTSPEHLNDWLARIFPRQADSTDPVSSRVKRAGRSDQAPSA